MLVGAFLAGCAASPGPEPRLVYVRQPAQGETLYLAEPVDARQYRRMGSSYFGTIRGGYGNPLERLHYRRAVTAEVRDKIADVFRHAGVRVENAAQGKGPVGTADIRVFEARNNPWAFPLPSRHVAVDIRFAIDDGRGRELWAVVIRSDTTDGKASAPSGNAAVMGPWLLRELEDELAAAVAQLDVAAVWSAYRERQH